MPPRRFKRTRRSRKPRQSAKPRSKVDKKLSRRISKLESSIEHKYIDTVSDLTLTNSGGAISLLSAIDDGTDYNERVGNQITAKKVFMQYRLYHESFAVEPGGTPEQVRVILFWDVQFNSNVNFTIFTGPSPTSLELSGALLDNRGGMVTVNAPYNINTSQRFKILYDKVHNMNHGSDLYGVVVNVKKMISLHGATIKYSDASIGVDSMPSRNLVMVAYDSLSTTAAQYNFTTRFFFTDL